jgi:flagellar hook-associated protein 1 FlgK
MGNSIFGAGLSGLRAAQLGILTTQHNITNASTPGYHRQEIRQTPALAQYSGAGFIGSGVVVDNIVRSYDEFLDGQVMQAETRAEYLDTYYSEIKQINDMLADPTSGLSPAMQEFFDAVNAVATNPSSVPARQSMLSGAESMISRFHVFDQRLAEIRNGINRQLESIAGVINSYAQQIAQLNQKITDAGMGTNGQLPNDLMDQRDQLVAELNKYVKVTVAKQDNGSYNVFIGNGQSLVLGNRAYTLKATPSSADQETLNISYVSGGNTILITPDNLQGGKLGALLAFRSEVLDPTQNALGRIAVGLAQSFNDQHKLGMDLNNQLGTDFFAFNGTTTPKAIPDKNNTGAAAIGAAITDVSKLTTSDYNLTWDGANYVLTRLSDKVVVGTYATLPQTTPDGFSISNSGAAPNPGDSWLIQPTRYGARDLTVAINDTSKIAAAVPISTSVGAGNLGTGQISAGAVNAPPPTDPNLTQTVTITFTSPTTFDVVGVGTGNPVGVPYTPGANITYNGWTIQITGEPAIGDTFTVSQNTAGIADSRNAVLLAGLQQQNTLIDGTASYGGAYSLLVGQVGNKTRETEVTSKAQATVVEQTRMTQQSFAGVNLDEEAANLIRYQQAYQAAAKMIEVASVLFDAILNIR